MLDGLNRLLYAKSVTMHLDGLRQWRARLRLASALVMLAFVICHLTAHCLLLVSFEDAEATRNVLMYPWRTWIGTGDPGRGVSRPLTATPCGRSISAARCASTAGNGRSSALGLCIPLLLMFHVVATRIAEQLLDVTTYYNTVFIVQWLMFPWLGAVQMIAVVTVWTHACIGIHYWLRTKRWYPKWRPLFFSFGLLLPSAGARRLCHRRQSGAARGQGRSRFRQFVARRFQSHGETA